MTIGDEVMRWTYALAVRPDVVALDIGLAALVIAFAIAAWRLATPLRSRRSDSRGAIASHARSARQVTRGRTPGAGRLTAVDRPTPARARSTGT